MSDDAPDQPELVDSSEAVGPHRYGALETQSLGAMVLHTDVEHYLDVAGSARADGFDQLIDLTAVDFLTYAGNRKLPESIEGERFELVTALVNHSRRERLRIRVQIPAEEPVVASVFDLWPGSEILEREVFDMFGIEFADHPDLTRVLMPEEWVGHPLRKDYAVGSIPVQFKAASNAR